MSVRLEHIIKTFDDVVALNNVSFEVADGELVTILGPSGCGKTTALRIIAGLELQDQGNVYIDGNRIDHVPTQDRNVGFVFQTYSLFRYMSVLENVEFGLKMRKVSKSKRRLKALDLLELVGLKGLEKRLPHALSGGQRQRVSLARALAYDPSTLLLDEPFGSLDAKIRKRLAIDLKRIQRDLKITTLFVTHDQAEALELGDRIIIINRGKIEQIGYPEEIYDHPRTKFVASFVGMVNVLDGRIFGRKVRLGSLEIDLVMDSEKMSYRDGDNIAVLIRPEDVLIANEEGEDAFGGTVRDIRFLGSYVELEIECGSVCIKAIETKSDLQRRNLKNGDEIRFSLQSSRIFKLTEDIKNVRERLMTLGYIE